MLELPLEPPLELELELPLPLERALVPWRVSSTTMGCQRSGGRCRT